VHALAFAARAVSSRRSGRSLVVDTALSFGASTVSRSNASQWWFTNSWGELGKPWCDA